jgi:hypothetical protein
MRRYILTSLGLFFLMNAWAGEVSFFPAFSFQHDATTSLTEVNLAFPFFHFSSRDGGAEARVPILFSYKKEVTTGKIFWDLVWPLFTYRCKPSMEVGGTRSQYTFAFLFSKSSRDVQDDSYRKWTFFPFFYTGSDKNNHRHLILFPFFWYAQDAYVYLPFPSTKPQSYFAFLPLYGDFRNLGGNDRILTLLWPLFIRVNNPSNQKYHFLWPFFAYGKGGGYNALKMWPLFSYASKEGEYTRLNYIWPLGYHRRTILKDGGVRAFDMLFPLFLRQRTPTEKWDYYLLYGRRETPVRSQWGILGPFFKTVRYKPAGGRGYSLLFSILKYKNGDDEKVRQFFPLFGYRTRPKQVFYYFLWPVFRHKTDDFSAYTYSRSYLFPFYIARDMEWQDGRWEKRRVVFPFFGSVRKSDGSWKTSSMRLFYYDTADAIDRNWSSLLPLYRSDGDGRGNFSTRVFEKLYHREVRNGYDLMEVNTLIFQWKRTGEVREYNLLGGVFGLKKSPEGTSLKIFFLPL